MSAILPNQIKAIYATAGRLGLCDKLDPKSDNLHALIYTVSGKDSVKKLTYHEARQVLKELEKSKAPGKMSEKQIAKAWAVFYKLKELSPSKVSDGERMAGIIKKVTGISCTKYKPFAWLSKEDGEKVIEMIKRYVETEKRKKAGSDAGEKGGF